MSKIARRDVGGVSDPVMQATAITLAGVCPVV